MNFRLLCLLLEETGPNVPPTGCSLAIIYASCRNQNTQSRTRWGDGIRKKKQTNFSLSSYVSGLTWLLFPQRWWKNGSPSPVAVIGSFRAGVLKETKNKPRCRQVRCRINTKRVTTAHLCLNIVTTCNQPLRLRGVGRGLVLPSYAQ